MSSASELCRIAVRAAGREIDLTVSPNTPIRVLLPAVLELITDDGDSWSQYHGHEVLLARPGAEPFDPRKSLVECGIHEGDLLVLIPQTPRPRETSFDVCSAVRQAVIPLADPVPTPPTTLTTTVAASWAAALCAILIGWPLLSQHTARHWIVGAACWTLAAAATAIAQKMRCAETLLVALAAAVIVFSSLTAALALPGDPGLSHLLLAASACSVASMAMERLLGCGTRILIPISGVSALIATAAFGAVLSWWSTEMVGAILVSCGLALVTATPRLATRAAHISVEAIDGDLSARARVAQDWLSHLVCISTAATAVGTIFIAVTSPPAAATTALVVAVEVKLLLHSRRHRDGRRVGMFRIGAGIAATALVCSIATAAPNTIPWLCLSVVLAVAIFHWFIPNGGRKFSVATHVNDALEFAVTAAVVPLMCWSTGVFSTMRSVGVS